jgi:hypothetical protein
LVAGRSVLIANILLGGMIDVRAANGWPASSNTECVLVRRRCAGVCAHPQVRTLRTWQNQ